MNSQLNFLVSGEKDDETKLKAELLQRLDEAIAEYLKENKQKITEIRWLQRKNEIASFFARLIEMTGDLLWTVWRLIDGTLEAYDSIPDILQSYVQQFKQK